jgi:hypothetical protein
MNAPELRARNPSPAFVVFDIHGVDRECRHVDLIPKANEVGVAKPNVSNVSFARFPVRAVFVAKPNAFKVSYDQFPVRAVFA